MKHQFMLLYSFKLEYRFVKIYEIKLLIFQPQFFPKFSMGRIHNQFCKFNTAANRPKKLELSDGIISF